MGKSAPPAPDYRGAAEEQAKASKENTEYQTWANRPNINTPFGKQTWSYTPGGTPASFDQAGYDRAMADWNAMPETSSAYTRGGGDKYDIPSTDYRQSRGPAPTREQFTTAAVEGPGSWTTNIELTPDQQSALDSQMRIQKGRSNAAETLLGQATSAFQTPMDWNSLPAMDTGSDLGGFAKGPEASRVSGQPIQSRLGQYGNVQSQIDNSGLSSFGAPSGLGQFSKSPAANRVTGGAITGDIGYTGDIQNSLTDTAGGWRQKGQSAIEQLMAPQLAERRSALESRLANQGITMGSDAWNSAMRRMGDDETRAGLQAIEAGRQESDSLFSKDLSAGQFRNAAQQQAFAQALSRGQFANSAQAQDFGQRSSSEQQFFNNQMAALGREDQNTQRQFDAGMQQADFQNRARAQQFAERISQGEFANSAQQQQFAQALGEGQFNNAAQAQDFGQRSASEQQFFGNQMSALNRQDQTTKSTFDAGVVRAGLKNTARQQALAEMLQRRGQPLNELNALLTQQQVSMPTMPSFNPAGRAEAPQYMQAAQNQYSAALDQANAENAGFAGLTSGLFSLGSAAMRSPSGWGGLFSMSDKRLKKDISYLFTLPNGIRVYKYRFIGAESMEIGVIAQEVEEIMPEAVKRGPDGFLRINYDMVLK